MLTDCLLWLAPKTWHRVMRLMRLNKDIFHDWLPGFCPCEAG